MPALNRGRSLAQLLLLLAVPLAPATAAEGSALEAFATWTLHATPVPSGPDRATLVASLSGPLFVDAGEGPILAGRVTCTGTLTISLTDGSQTGEGVCAFTARDGAEAYGSWTCSGYRLLGCKGSFTFTGGAGRLAGIAGGGGFLIRGDLPGVASGTDEVVGIVQWHNLAMTLPGQD